MAVTSFYYDGSNEPKLAPLSSNCRSTPLIPKVFEQLPRNVLKRGRRGIQNSVLTEKNYELTIKPLCARLCTVHFSYVQLWGAEQGTCYSLFHVLLYLFPLPTHG